MENVKMSEIVVMEKIKKKYLDCKNMFEENDGYERSLEMFIESVLLR